MNLHYQVVITSEVHRELDEIHAYVRQSSPQNAESLIDYLWACLARLKFMPGRCPLASTKRFRGRRYRKLVARPYLIYFRIDDATQTVYVLSVRHGARRPE